MLPAKSASLSQQLLGHGALGAQNLSELTRQSSEQLQTNLLPSAPSMIFWLFMPVLVSWVFASHIVWPYVKQIYGGTTRSPM